MPDTRLAYLPFISNNKNFIKSSLSRVLIQGPEKVYWSSYYVGIMYYIYYKNVLTYATEQIKRSLRIGRIGVFYNQKMVTL